MKFAARRRRNLAITIAVSAILIGAHAVYTAALRDSAFLSGWLLLATVLFLALLNIRKKLPMLPVVSASAWLQWHIYAGWISIVLFILHIGIRFPDGWLETILAGLFVLVVGSGAVGLALSRINARRLTRHGEEVVFERIPVFIATLREEADALVVRSVAEIGSTTIADFYATHLKAFFDGPRNVVRHLGQSNRALFTLLTRIGDIERYLSPKEREVSAELLDLVRKKDALDYHYAHQATLKAWLFVHVPLTYGLLIVAAAHLVLAYAFTGGVS